MVVDSTSGKGPNFPVDFTTVQHIFETQVLPTFGQEIVIIRRTRILDADGNMTDDETVSRSTTRAVVSRVEPQDTVLLNSGYFRVGDITIIVPATVEVLKYDLVEWDGVEWDVDAVELPPLYQGRQGVKVMRGTRR